jgi:hypothetical protein
MTEDPRTRKVPEHRGGAPAWAARAQTDDEPVWPFVPLALSLEASAWRHPDDLEQPFCVEVGRRLLLAQLQSSEWILRRVEKLDMSRQEAVRRAITLELLVPEDAPVFVDSEGGRLRCVPVSLMQRRTLVGLDIRDERGDSVTMPGIRLTQQLDQAAVLAAAACSTVDETPGTVRDLTPEALGWIGAYISGTREQVQAAYVRLADGSEASLAGPAVDPLFANAVHRFRHGFTLYVFLDESHGRHRLIHLSFEEPTDWRYQKPRIGAPVSHPALAGAPGDRHYTVGVPGMTIRGVLARLGLIPQRVRFQVPGAEYAASFHFELSAPPGVRIVRATLLAGRPNDPRRHVSLDEVRGHTPTVGLHAVEVPNGSLCRVQADLCLAARGYLGMMLVANIAMVLLLGVVITHASPDRAMEPDEVTNVILFLISAVAAAAALVAQGDIGGLSARFITAVRVLTTAALAFPVITAVFLTFEGHRDSITSIATTYHVLQGLFVASVVICAGTLLAWLGSWVRERASLVSESPWDMTRAGPPRRTVNRVVAWKKAVQAKSHTPEDFNDVLRQYHFHSAAVGINSAEGWHTVYAWDDAKQYNAVAALEACRWLGGAADTNPGRPSFASTCARRSDRCPSASRQRPSV